MNHETLHYNRNDLQQLLDDSLPEASAREIADHIAACVECRQQLEALADHENWWPNARDSVKSILDNPTAYTSSSDDVLHRNFGSSSAASDDSFATDFAVDFLEPSDDPKVLGRLGEYEICEVIGRGGMGVVLKGYQKDLHRHVAVKVLAPHLATSGAARRRFAREAQATAAIVNPHVMAIHSVHANAKLPYLVMPFVPCESLQQRLDRQGPLELRDILRIGTQAARGLAAAHAQGLVHRDVKPANILLETNVDRVMLTDFGLARAVDDATLTRTGIIAGTPQYMSPEQANGDAVDHRSDLFSLGSVLYAMCTARPPFRAETTFGVLRRIREAAPRPIREINADIPEWLDHFVMKLLSKEASSRIATATEVASLLERCVAHVQQPTTVALPEEFVGWAILPVRNNASNAMRTSAIAKPTRRRFALLGVVAAGVLATILLPVTVWYRSTFATKEDVAASPAVPVASPSTEPLTGDTLLSNNPLLEWNATQREIDEATRTIEQLDAEAKKDLE